MNDLKSINLNALRLCFQVFLEGPAPGEFRIPLKPIVSSPIYNKKTIFELMITELSRCNAQCDGGQKIILLCEQVNVCKSFSSTNQSSFTFKG